MSQYFFTHRDADPGPEVRKRREIRRKFHELDFESWLDRRWQRYRDGKRARTQLRKLTDEQGNVIVDHVGRLENLQPTCDWLCAVTGLASLDMPHRNSTNKGHYSQHYNNTTREIVAELYREDIEYFGYRFDE